MVDRAMTTCSELAPTTKRHVLVAVDAWQQDLKRVLEQVGFFVLLADSKDAALFALQNQSPDAVVMISDWALESSRGAADGLMEVVRGKIPTVSLISGVTWEKARKRWFDYLYAPPLHEYISLPADVDEFVRRLNKVLKATDDSVGV
jgi:DNA-binding response OmpR family regulator